MRRTLTVLVATAALLAPAAAASAAPGSNASCNNGKGGNYEWTGHTDNGNGNGKKRGTCAPTTDETPPPGTDEPVEEDKDEDDVPVDIET